MLNKDTLLFFFAPKIFLQTNRGKRLLANWAKLVKIRDKRCLKCGSTIKLEAHHIKQKNKYPKLALKLWNGATLCNKCHKKFHKIYGLWGGVKEFKKFLSNPS